MKDIEPYCYDCFSYPCICSEMGKVSMKDQLWAMGMVIGLITVIIGIVYGISCFVHFAATII